MNRHSNPYTNLSKNHHLIHFHKQQQPIFSSPIHESYKPKPWMIIHNMT